MNVLAREQQRPFTVPSHLHHLPSSPWPLSDSAFNSSPDCSSSDSISGLNRGRCTTTPEGARVIREDIVSPLIIVMNPRKDHSMCGWFPAADSEMLSSPLHTASTCSLPADPSTSKLCPPLMSSYNWPPMTWFEKHRWFPQSPCVNICSRIPVMSTKVGASVFLSPMHCQFLLRNWTLLGAISSCSVHPCKNHSGQPSKSG